MSANEKERKEKLEGGDVDISSSSPVLKRLENFWFYHKWKIIVIAFFAIVIAVGVFQMVGKTEPDVTVVVAVPEYISPNQSAEIANSLESLLVGDPNSDGSREVLVMSYTVYSEEELEAANEEETDENGRNIIKVDRAYNVSQFESYTAYLQTGECSVMIISEYLYGKLRDQDRLVHLSYLFGEKNIAGALDDGYGIRLGDVGAYEFFDTLKALPADTVVCIMRPYIWGASSDSEKYQISEDFFKALISFEN